jgi:hypothetical protein
MKGVIIRAHTHFKNFDMALAQNDKVHTARGFPLVIDFLRIWPFLIKGEFCIRLVRRTSIIRYE